MHDKVALRLRRKRKRQPVHRLSRAVDPGGGKAKACRRRRIPSVGRDEQHLGGRAIKALSDQFIDFRMWFEDADAFHRQHRIQRVTQIEVL